MICAARDLCLGTGRVGHTRSRGRIDEEEKRSGADEHGKA